MTRSPWTIRRAGSRDAAALALVGAASFLETFAGTLAGDDIVAHCAERHDAAVYRHWIGAGSPVWLAETRAWAAPIGYAVLSGPDLPLGDVGAGDAELKRIYVLAPFQGAGLGHALMALAMEQARADGYSRLLLGVYRGNARARAFYERQGFTAVGERRIRFGATDHGDVILARALG